MRNSVMAWRLHRFAQMVALGAFALLALALTTATILAAAGILPWLEARIALSDGTVLEAGMWLQVGLAALSVMLLAYMPSHFRMIALERAHRDFRIRMEDVSRAYWAAHQADRTGIFKMKSQYDAVRERMMFLRDHPDLGSLEPDILEVAAQMSSTSEELARIYSDENVVRAKDFLAQREAETKSMQERIAHAQDTVIKMRRRMERVDLDEDVAASQLKRLKESLSELLPELGLSMPETANSEEREVIKLPPPRKGRALNVAAE